MFSRFVLLHPREARRDCPDEATTWLVRPAISSGGRAPQATETVWLALPFDFARASVCPVKHRRHQPTSSVPSCLRVGLVPCPPSPPPPCPPSPPSPWPPQAGEGFSRGIDRATRPAVSGMSRIDRRRDSGTGRSFGRAHRRSIAAPAVRRVRATARCRRAVRRHAAAPAIARGRVPKAASSQRRCTRRRDPRDSSRAERGRFGERALQRSEQNSAGRIAPDQEPDEAVAQPAHAVVEHDGARHALADHEKHARKLELAGDLVDDVDLAGVEAGRERLAGTSNWKSAACRSGARSSCARRPAFRTL